MESKTNGGTKMSIESVERAWQELACRSDLVGKKVVFKNRVADSEDQGTIRRIMVENGYVTIESPEIEAAHAAGHAWSPNIKFKLDEERDPHKVGDTIFCDLDERRQIRISA
jgi:hypothetical protein